MYGYFVNAVLIFLTHPGIIIPVSTPGILSAVGQVFLVLTLNMPSDKVPSVANAAAMLYYIVFFVWAFIKARITMWSAVIKTGVSGGPPRIGR
jgi:hypothetical protein